MLALQILRFSAAVTPAPKYSSALVEPSSDTASKMIPWTAAREPLPPPNGNVSCSHGMLRLPHATMPVCLLENDFISNVVRERGRWPDCDELVTLWNSLPAGITPGSNFLELGGNIGMCTLAMLASTDAKELHVFEPSPEALFYLTSNLRRAAEQGNDRWRVRERVKVYSVAASSAAGSTELFTQNFNLGNAAVGTPVLDNPAHKGLYIRNVYNVTLARVDDVIPDSTRFRMAKIDVQGSECSALAGMARLLRKRAVSVLRTEIGENFLRAQGCSGAKLIAMLEKSGFELERAGGDETGVDVTARLKEPI